MMKLQFIQRLVKTNCNYVVKRIFLQRLYEGMNNVSMMGFVPDILRILELCDLKDSLMTYMHGGRFPTKHAWKLMTKNAVVNWDYGRACHNLRNKTDCDRYIRSMSTDNHAQMHPFYNIMRRTSVIRDNKAIWFMIKIISLPSRTYDVTSCKLCGKDFVDIVCHIITQCPPLYQERNILWDYTMDTLDVRLSVKLSCMEDERFLEKLILSTWNGFSRLTDKQTDTWYHGLAKVVHEQFINGFQANYPWLKNYM